jgi:hypothetical protein
MLTGFLRAHGVSVFPIDANLECWDSLLRPEPLEAFARRIDERLAALESRAALGHAEQRELGQLIRALGDAAAAPHGIAEARAVLKDEQRFFDPDDYERAVQTIESACRLISAAHAPLELSFSGWRTPFALTTPDEIARDASPERDPFHSYIVDDLAPRLRADGARVVGISVCFPGQLQPAYAFGLALKRLLPDVHLTWGGPGVTQLLLRHSGHDLARALGPFDSAVLFEGEHTLLQLVRAVESGASLRDIPNVVTRDRLLGARYVPGHSSEDLRQLPAPDFDGLPLDKYFSPVLVLPYDPTRGCYWGKCTFCHYGLAEVGTASYRERPVETALAHLAALREKYGTRYVYLSQDSVAPKTLLKLADGIAERGLDVKWATDLKAEKYLNADRAARLKRGGAIACAIGVESGNDRVLQLIDKGAPVAVVAEVMRNLAANDIAVEAMCFTDFPTESFDEALDTIDLIDGLRDAVALYIVGEFDLTDGALVAQQPEKFGLTETYRLDGDLLKTGLFYEEAEPSKVDDEPERLDEALGELGRGWKLRRYPWAGSLSTAHTVAWYERFGPDIFRRLADQPRLPPFGARPVERASRFDLAALAEAELREQALWTHLVRERRHVSRAAYDALAAELPSLKPRLGRYRFVAGEPPIPVRAPAVGRRPKNAQNAAG